MIIYLGINYTHHWKSMFKKANDRIFQKLATRSKIGFTVMVKTNLRVSFTIYSNFSTKNSILHLASSLLANLAPIGRVSFPCFHLTSLLVNLPTCAEFEWSAHIFQKTKPSSSSGWARPSLCSKTSATAGWPVSEISVFNKLSFLLWDLGLQWTL